MNPPACAHEPLDQRRQQPLRLDRRAKLHRPLPRHAHEQSFRFEPLHGLQHRGAADRATPAPGPRYAARCTAARATPATAREVPIRPASAIPATLSASTVMPAPRYGGCRNSAVILRHSPYDVKRNRDGQPRAAPRKPGTCGNGAKYCACRPSRASRKVGHLHLLSQRLSHRRHCTIVSANCLKFSD